ncbi:DUF378 domain-containing protein [Candidatus Dependentiae bacterium]|nr:DUF378 domain-containing protein [Candidatus Dependentiae bacterium]
MLLNYIAHVLCSIGAINWGLVAFFRFNLVEFICKYIPIPKLNLVIYGLVFLAGIYSLVILFMCCKSLTCYTK